MSNKRLGVCHYNEDPKGFKSFHSQCVMKDAVKGWAHKVCPFDDFSQLMVNKIALIFR